MLKEWLNDQFRLDNIDAHCYYADSTRSFCIDCKKSPDDVLSYLINNVMAELVVIRKTDDELVIRDLS